jgi:hypothetical protein
MTLRFLQFTLLFISISGFADQAMSPLTASLCSAYLELNGPKEEAQGDLLASLREVQSRVATTVKLMRPERSSLLQNVRDKIFPADPIHPGLIPINVAMQRLSDSHDNEKLKRSIKQITSRIAQLDDDLTSSARGNISFGNKIAGVAQIFAYLKDMDSAMARRDGRSQSQIVTMIAPGIAAPLTKDRAILEKQTLDRISQLLAKLKRGESPFLYFGTTIKYAALVDAAEKSSEPEGDIAMDVEDRFVSIDEIFYVDEQGVPTLLNFARVKSQQEILPPPRPRKIVERSRVSAMRGYGALQPVPIPVRGR